MTDGIDEPEQKTAHDVQLPARAEQHVTGYQDTWYFERDGEIVAVRGDEETTRAFWMLAHDLEDEAATVHEGVPASELPTEFQPVAADGGEHGE
jgi:hypothetical protein